MIFDLGLKYRGPLEFGDDLLTDLTHVPWSGGKMTDLLKAALQGPGTLVARLHAGERMIRVVGTGVWSLALLERHIEELQRLLAKARASGTGLRVLSDLSRASVQSPDVAARIERLTTEAYDASDRIAIVVASSLLKFQMRRVVRRAQLEVFLSIADAETWLNATVAVEQHPRGFVARAPRHNISIVTTMRSGDMPAYAIRVVNASTTGLLIDGRGDLPVGARLETDLPGIGPVKGFIVRVRSSLAGIKFDRAIALEQLALA